MKDPSLEMENPESITNYRSESVNALLEQILKPIWESLKKIALETLPDRKSHLDHMKEYQKKLRKVLEIDHVQEIQRATCDKGIIGESDAEAIERRKLKSEWNCCLNVITSLGNRLGKMIKDDPTLGDYFMIEVDIQSPAYPLTLQLLKIIKK